jgi:hypothetical protein
MGPHTIVLLAFKPKFLNCKWSSQAKIVANLFFIIIIELYYPKIFELFGLSKIGAFSSKCPFKSINQY